MTHRKYVSKCERLKCKTNKCYALNTAFAFEIDVRDRYWYQPVKRDDQQPQAVKILNEGYVNPLPHYIPIVACSSPGYIFPMCHFLCKITSATDAQMAPEEGFTV